ncbi:MAG: prephenate dehydratase [Desulfovibrio sp.]|jgi:chorismate mutase/prephenate dehydratase|nr:prephenate dehydratase [Desulfovibrio sp.]
MTESPANAGIRPDPAERLAAIRTEIDAADAALLDLLNRRASLSLEVGSIKKDMGPGVFKPLREREVLESLVRRNPGPLPADHLRAVWREIFSSSRALQRPQCVAYLGPEGTFSHFAGVEYLGHAASFHPCADIARVFEEVSSGQCDLGVVPLENSLQGTVGVSFDFFLNHDVFIQAELFARISHCLFSDASSLAAIGVVYSHPQPLAQCGGWLRAHLPKAALVPVESTAAAARNAAGNGSAAAIGHRKLSDMLGLGILARRIEDLSDNWTRFVIIGHRAACRLPPAPAANGAADKTSLLFTLPDKAGALSGVLSLLADSGINMRKLESRPLRGQTWRYVFFADVESDLTARRHAALRARLEEACTSFRILGAYPAGPRLEHDSGENADGDDRDAP